MATVEERMMIVKTGDGRELSLPASTPEDAPLPMYDPNDPNLTIDDVMPANYFNREVIQQQANEHGVVIGVFDRIAPELVFDPQDGAASGDWPLVLNFSNLKTKLVLNKTRVTALSAMAGHERVISKLNSKLQGTVLALGVGSLNGHEQVTIQSVEAAGLQDEDLPF